MKKKYYTLINESGLLFSKETDTGNYVGEIYATRETAEKEKKHWESWTNEKFKIVDIPCNYTF